MREKMKKILILLTLILSVQGGCTREKTKENFPLEVLAFTKPEDATSRIEGQSFPYCLWYNPDQWFILDTPFDHDFEKSEWYLALLPADQRTSIGNDMNIRAAARIYTYSKKNATVKEFKRFIQKNILEMKEISEFRDLGSENRIVNHLKVTFWGFSFKTKDLGLTKVFSYLYSDNEGTVAVITYTVKPGDHEMETERSMIDLLNGFCLLRAKN